MLAAMSVELFACRTLPNSPIGHCLTFRYRIERFSLMKRAPGRITPSNDANKVLGEGLGNCRRAPIRLFD